MFDVFVRKQLEVNTDPQRRCYNGAHARSEMVWTDWSHICSYSTRKDAEEAVVCFKTINPLREYRVESQP